MMAARAVMLLLLMSSAAAAESRGTRIAMAVALLDVTEDYCGGTLQIDEAEKARLMTHFHEYDIAGLASMLSRPLNAFYEDFAHRARQGRRAFCTAAPAEARKTGYPVILPGGG